MTGKGRPLNTSAPTHCPPLNPVSPVVGTVSASAADAVYATLRAHGLSCGPGGDWVVTNITPEAERTENPCVGGSDMHTRHIQTHRIVTTDEEGNISASVDSVDVTLMGEASPSSQ